MPRIIRFRFADELQIEKMEKKNTFEMVELTENVRQMLPIQVDRLMYEFSPNQFGHSKMLCS